MKIIKIINIDDLKTQLLDIYVEVPCD